MHRIESLIMPDSLFTVRRFQARSDLQDAFRVQLSTSALQSLKLSPGDICDIGVTNNIYLPAIAWPASDKLALGPKIAQMSNVLQDLGHYNLGDRISIYRSEGPVTEPQNVVLVANDRGDDASTVHPGYWRRSMENLVTDAGYIWVGMVFTLPRQRRSFQIVRIDYSESTDQLYRVGPGTSISIDNEFVPSKRLTVMPRLAMKRDGVGGLAPQMDELDTRFEDYSDNLQHLRYPSYYQPFEGAVLLHGPPGTGKSLLLSKAARASWKQIINIDLYRGENGSRPTLAQVQKRLTNVERLEPGLLTIDGLELCTRGAAARA